VIRDDQKKEVTSFRGPLSPSGSKHGLWLETLFENDRYDIDFQESKQWYFYGEKVPSEAAFRALENK
jgi:hypothetical protein